jgi:hypothetical protein
MYRLNWGEDGVVDTVVGTFTLSWGHDSHGQPEEFEFTFVASDMDYHTFGSYATRPEVEWAALMYYYLRVKRVMDEAFGPEVFTELWEREWGQARPCFPPLKFLTDAERAEIDRNRRGLCSTYLMFRRPEFMEDVYTALPGPDCPQNRQAILDRWPDATFLNDLYKEVTGEGDLPLDNSPTC